MRRLVFLALLAALGCAAPYPAYVDKFKTEVLATLNDRGEDPAECDVQASDGKGVSDEPGYLVTVECTHKPTKCAFFAMPRGFAVLGCMPNEAYKEPAPQRKI